MRIYFSGIGGVGIGPLAMLAQDAGHKIVGSDMNVSTVSKELESRGVQISYMQDGSYIRQTNEAGGIDILVHTAAIRPDHPELMYAKENNIEVVKRDDLLNRLMDEKGMKMLAVSGTHGKTTTTGMLAWLFEKLEIPYSHSIGSTIKFAPIGRYQEGSEYFLYEADEFDRNFLNFRPHASLLTVIDYDHPDTYITQEDYDKAFADFIALSEQTVMWKDDLARFELDEAANIDVLDDQKYQHYNFPNSIGIKLAGAQNRRNATLVAEYVSKYHSIDLQTCVDHLNEFPGTDRRFEKIRDYLFSDYAHHPTEIQAVLQMANELGHDVVVIYQPHQNIRQHHLKALGTYKGSFDTADKVYWLPTYMSREDPNLEVLKPEELSEGLENETDLEHTFMNEELKAKIEKHLLQEDVVVAMSAGDLDAWIRENFAK